MPKSSFGFRRYRRARRLARRRRPKTAGVKALRMVRRMNRAIEVKTRLVISATNAPGSSTSSDFYRITSVPLGDQDNQREGSKITGLRCRIFGNIVWNTTIIPRATWMRVVIFHDTQPSTNPTNDSASPGGDLVLGNQMNSEFNIDTYRKRYRIVKDWQFRPRAMGGLYNESSAVENVPDTYFSLSFKAPRVISYFDTTDTNWVKGAMWVCAWSQSSTPLSTLQLAVRLWYKDT